MLRAIFISDVHLGSRRCQAAALLSFLRNNPAKYIYLVGDFLDSNAFTQWPDNHYDVIDLLVTLASSGTHVVYVPGNHDAFMRYFTGKWSTHMSVALHAVHTTFDGRRLLVVHGDQFDAVIMRCARWWARTNDIAYDVVRHVSKRLAHYLMRLFERRLLAQAERGGYDGVIAGHIHGATYRRVGLLEYYNCGDWFDLCSAVVEHCDGSLQLTWWRGERRCTSAS